MKLFKKVDGGVPAKSGWYHTSRGTIYFFREGRWTVDYGKANAKSIEAVDWWLEEYQEQAGPQPPAQEAMRRIPVSEKKPPFGELVLIVSDKLTWRVGRLDRIDIVGNRFETATWDSKSDSSHYDITHWLPLSVLDEYFK